MFTLMDMLGSSSKSSKLAKSGSSQKPKSKPHLAPHPPKPPPPTGPPPHPASHRPRRKAAEISSTKSHMSEQANEPEPTGPLDQPVKVAASSARSRILDLPLSEEDPSNLEDSFLNELPAEREELPEEIANILPIPVVDDQPSIMVGVSGVASSGKTTLAHLLSSIIPPDVPVLLLQQDDFLVPKHLLVPLRNGELDADGPDAIDLAALKRVLNYAKHTGKLPPGFHTVQAEADEHARAISSVSQDELEDLKALISRSELFQAGRPVAIVDGSLLYHDPKIRSLFDVKILLRASRELSRRRRFEKPEYTGSESGEDFWRTREYFDRVLWSNYSEEFGPLFENGDVQGRPIVELCERLGIAVQPELDPNVSEIVKWAAESIIKDLSNQKFLKTREHVSRSQRYEICRCDQGWLGKIRQTIFDLL
ncbi:ribosylnicotinamide kinase [Pseudocyphellaria aurata]|nr:ribosylnicotinamide kinase [Pseudocyphellaria aurata]